MKMFIVSCSKNNTLAFRLIELAVVLDSPRPLPRSLLKQLSKDTSGNLIAARILQGLVLTRLYMFKTSEVDMQWVSNELGLSIDGLHVITYAKKRARRLN
jgi:hypothetical protein